jgi:hypothetical protein
LTQNNVQSVVQIFALLLISLVLVFSVPAHGYRWGLQLQKWRARGASTASTMMSKVRQATVVAAATAYVAAHGGKSKETVVPTAAAAPGMPLRCVSEASGDLREAQSSHLSILGHEPLMSVTPVESSIAEDAAPVVRQPVLPLVMPDFAARS